jgi:dTDP-4-amino-4,6-dideoxygalactose transaminase
MMQIKFVDLGRQNKEIEKELLPIMSNIINRCDFILGKEVGLFEKEFANFIGAKYALGVGNGTDALHLCLKSLNIKANDGVIVPVNTFIATALSVVYLGARPIFVDCNEKNFNLDIDQVKMLLKKFRKKLRIKAIIPVHLYGQCCDMDEILSIAKEYDIKVIEDACQAHGAKYKNKSAGTFGIAAAFSFYPGKNLGCFGDGGAVVTNDEEIYKKILMLRNYGQREKYIHIEVGFNSRLDTLQAGVLRIKLKYLAKWNQQRQEIAKLYFKKLLNENIILPQVDPDFEHIWHLFVIRIKTNQRDELRQYLKEKGIETGIHYPIPLHLSPAFKYLGYKRGDFPVAEKISDEILSLPMFPGMTEDEIDYISTTIAKFPWKS